MPDFLILHGRPAQCRLPFGWVSPAVLLGVSSLGFGAPPQTETLAHRRSPHVMRVACSGDEWQARSSMQAPDWSTPLSRQHARSSGTLAGHDC